MMRSRRITAAAAALLGSAILLMAAGASGALAETHPLLFSFGAFSNPNGIAIDEATGEVYVADIGTDSVYKFNAAGSPVNFASLGSNVLSGASTPAGAFSFPSEYGSGAAIAVDNSGNPADPSLGDLYVMDAGHDVIDKFNASGAYLGQITGPFPTAPIGLGVAPDGDVRVESRFPNSGEIEAAAIEFDDSAANNYIKTVPIGGEYTPLENQTAEAGLAIGPNGDDYLLVGCGCMERFGEHAAAFGRVDAGGSDVAAAVDPSTGHLYVDGQSSVTEWDPGDMNGRVAGSRGNEEVATGAQVSTFGGLVLSGSSGEGGIAVDGASGRIYVSNPAAGQVDAFGSAAPGVSVGKPADITKTTAILQGAVDPRGDAVASCEFEYGTTSSYGQSVPCEQTPGQIGAGTSAVVVSADIGGLQAGLLYHFRLNAANGEGTSFTSGLFATTGPGFGIKDFEVAFLNKDGTPDTQAGSHPYEMVTNIAFNTHVVPDEPDADAPYVVESDGNFKDVVTDLPPGLVGDPNATTKKCTLRQLDITGEKIGELAGDAHGEPCPAESFVGYLEVEFADEQPVPHTGHLGLFPIKTPVYNMVPPRGVAVQFGAHFIIPNALIEAGVRAGGDYPVEANVINAPVMMPVQDSRLTIFGVPSDAEPRTPLLTLPTGCNGPLKSTLSTDSYQEPGHFVEASTLTSDSGGHPLALTGCSKLVFPPTITVSPDTSNASSSSGLTVGVHISQKAALNPDGLAESALRNTTVTLPEGVALNPAGADGLEACSEALAGFTGFSEFNSEFEPGVKTASFTPEMPEPLRPGANFCPDGSKIGTVKIQTPLLEHELEGAVYLASQNANPFGSLVAMYLIAEDPVSGTLIKLTGEVSLSATGQIVTTFKNTPDLPFENLELHFFGGERAPLTTPSRCGTYTTNAAFVPWDGNGTVDTSASFEIDHGPHGGPCPGASLPFEPSLTAGTTSIQAGGFSPFTMTMSRPDGSQSLQSISLGMPSGLSGLLSSVELCPEPQASEGTCGPNSLIGETIVSVGIGGDPYSVKGGKVYITGPYDGAPFGLSIVNPAKAGPYDLGQGAPCDCVLVRAKIEVNPLTAALTVTTDSSGPFKIPTILDGIPLQIQHVNVTINRPGFTFNPTNCNPTSITASLTSAEGGLDALSVPFQATNCATLAFKPTFTASTSSKTSRRDGASLKVSLTYPKGSLGKDANIHEVKVELPKQLPARSVTLNHACLVAVFNVNPSNCPAESRVGYAKAITPILPVPLAGPAYFVSYGGAKFPELVLVLQGYGVTIDLHGETFIDEKTSVISSTFKSVPDQPVSSFELTLPQGEYSALAANGSFCSQPMTIPTTFIAQNGMELKQATSIAVAGCKPALKVLRHSIKGDAVTVTVQVPSAGTLSGAGGGLASAHRKVSKAGTATIRLAVTPHDRRLLAEHAGRKLKLSVRLRFTPKHGAVLSKEITVLMR